MKPASTSASTSTPTPTPTSNSQNHTSPSITRLKALLHSPSFALGLAPMLFAFSQIIILGYNWLHQGYAGDLTLTISRYVGLNLWTSVLFALINIFIVMLMLNYYLSLRKSRSNLWFILGCLQSFTFLLLSLFPHNIFVTNASAREIVNTIHGISARTMFFSMFAISLETLRLTRQNRFIFPKYTTEACVVFIIYAVFYLVGYLSGSPLVKNLTLIIESGYIYAFMALLLITHKAKLIKTGKPPKTTE